MDREQDNEQNDEVQNVTFQVPLAPTFVYSNASAYALSLMEMRISFGEAMPDHTVQPRTGVTLPIEHCVHLAFSLCHNLLAYDRNFGPPRHPEWGELKNALIRGGFGPPVPRAPQENESGQEWS